MLSHELRFIESGRVLLEDKMSEALLRWEQRTIYSSGLVLYCELFSTWNRSRSQKLFVVVPYGGGASLAVPILLFDVAGVGRTKELKQVQLKLSGVEFTKNQVHIVLLGISLLKHNHAIEELHVSAPPGDRLQSLLSVADFSEELKPLIPLSLGLAKILTWKLLRVAVVVLISVRMSELVFLLGVKLWLLQALQDFQRNELMTCSVYRVPQSLVTFSLLDLIDIRVVLIENVNFAGVHKLSVRTDGRVRFFVTDNILRVALLKLIENNRGWLFLEQYFHLL